MFRSLLRGLILSFVYLNAASAANTADRELITCVPGKPAKETIEGCTKIISLPEIDQPTLHSALLIRGDAYSSLNELQLAAADYERAQKISYSPIVSFALGGIYVNLGRSEDAITEFTKIIDSGAATAQVYNARGAAFQNAGKFDQSISDFNRALDLAPKLLGPLNNRAAAYAKKGDYKAAVKDIDAVLAINPDMPLALVNRCGLLARDGQFDMGRPACDKAQHLDPDNYFTMLGIGGAYYDAGRFEDAIRYYDISLRLQPNNPRTLYMRGVAESKLGNEIDSKADILAAERIQPDIASFMARQGLK